MCRNYIDAFSKAKTNVPCEYKGKAYQSCNEYLIHKNKPDIALSVNKIAKIYGATKTQEEAQKFASQLTSAFFPNKSAKSNDMPSAGAALGHANINTPSIGDNLTMLVYCNIGYVDMLASIWHADSNQFTTMLSKFISQRNCNPGRNTKSTISRKDIDSADWRHAGESWGGNIKFTLYIMKAGNNEALWVKQD